MAGLYSYAILSNLPKTTRSICAESLIIEAMKLKGRTVAVNLDADLWLSCGLPKNNKDDSVARYGKVIGAAEAPVFNREEFKEFLKDAGRQKNAELARDRSLLVFLDKPPEKEVMPVFDAMCFIVSPDHSSIPFIFSVLKIQNETGYHVPIKIVIAGEPYIEKATEFFVGIRKELEGLRGNGPEIGFAGNIYFDQDQYELAISYNLPYIEAFPGSFTHGQVRYVINRLFVKDVSRVVLADKVYLDLLGTL